MAGVCVIVAYRPKPR